MAQRKVKSMFVYTVLEKTGVWFFDGERYHNFQYKTYKFYYIRSTRVLPPGARGQSAEIELDGFRLLIQAAKEQGIKLVGHRSAENAEKAEMKKNHPEYIFGMTEPAGVIYLENTGYYFDEE